MPLYEKARKSGNKEIMEKLVPIAKKCLNAVKKQFDICKRRVVPPKNRKPSRATTSDKCEASAKKDMKTC
jgi:hypothetical protein